MILVSSQYWTTTDHKIYMCNNGRIFDDSLLRVSRAGGTEQPVQSLSVAAKHTGCCSLPEPVDAVFGRQILDGWQFCCLLVAH